VVTSNLLATALKEGKQIISGTDTDTDTSCVYVVVRVDDTSPPENSSGTTAKYHRNTVIGISFTLKTVPFL